MDNQFTSASIGYIAHKCPFCGIDIPRFDMSVIMKRDPKVEFPEFIFDKVGRLSVKQWTYVDQKNILCPNCKESRNYTINIAQNELHEDDRYYG